eukprot:g12723.t1
MNFFLRPHRHSHDDTVAQIACDLLRALALSTPAIKTEEGGEGLPPPHTRKSISPDPAPDKPADTTAHDAERLLPADGPLLGDADEKPDCFERLLLADGDEDEEVDCVERLRPARLLPADDDEHALFDEEIENGDASAPDAPTTSTSREHYMTPDEIHQRLLQLTGLAWYVSLDCWAQGPENDLLLVMLYYIAELYKFEKVILTMQRKF